MKIFREYCVAVVWSFEFVLLVVGTAMLFWPKQIEILSSNLVNTPENLKHLSLLPTAMAVWVFNENKKLLFPESDKDGVLQKWPDYWRLKVYFKVSLGYSLVFAVMGLFVWLLGYEISDANGFLLLLTSIIGGFIVVISTYFAKIQQKEIFIALSD